MRVSFFRPALMLLGALTATAAWTEPQSTQAPGKVKHGFQGYWMGVDPTDGGDARRSLLQRDDGTYEMAARDSVLTLCDSTDRGFASFEDGKIVERNVLQSDSLTIRCFDNGASVVLHVRYELVGPNVMIEHTTQPDGSFVSTIVLHRISAN